MRRDNLDPAVLSQLQADYIQALDTQNMPQWLAQFSDDPAASYICTTREHVKNGLPLALMLDDCHARLEDRVTYITKIWAGTFQNYQTRHLTQPLRTKWVDHETVEMTSGFVVYYTAEELGITQVLASGEYEDVVRLEQAGARFFSKKAILDTSVLPRYLVYPL